MAFSLTAVFGVDTTGVKTEIRQLRRDMNSFVADTAKLGAGIAVGFFVALSKNAIELGSKLSDLSIQLGINVEKLQVLNAIARDAGVQQETMAKSIVKVRTSAQEAFEGNKTYAHSFAVLGVNIKQFMSLPAEQRLVAIAQAMKNTTDKNAAYNAVATIFGEKVGPKMMEILGVLANTSFPKLEASAKKSGDVMSAEVIVALDKAGDAIEAFKQRATIAIGNIIVNFRSAEGIYLLGLQFAKAAFVFGARIADAITEGGSLIWAVYKGAFLGVCKIFYDALISTFVGAARQLNKVLPDRLQINIEGIEKLKTAGTGVADEIAKAIAQTKPSTFAKDVEGVYDGLIADQQKIVNQLNKVDFGPEAKKLIDAGDAIQRGGAAAAEAVKNAVEPIKDIIIKARALIDGIRGGSVFNELSDAALKEVVRQNRAEADRLTNSAYGPGNIGKNLEAARLEAESLNAQQELDVRNRFRTDVSAKGIDAARHDFDPVAFESLLQRFGPDSQETQKQSLNVLTDIKNALTNKGIRTIPLTG